mmetsp:Transcript_43794/g.80989  ORF Transcript_43794/g.80989 Transcript_43794/m.80989 type:complete len:210 (-) Transcript_43794:848-1477(-)
MCLLKVFAFFARRNFCGLIRLTEIVHRRLLLFLRRCRRHCLDHNRRRFRRNCCFIQFGVGLPSTFITTGNIITVVFVSRKKARSHCRRRRCRRRRRRCPRRLRQDFSQRHLGSPAASAPVSRAWLPPWPRPASPWRRLLKLKQQRRRRPPSPHRRHHHRRLRRRFPERGGTRDARVLQTPRLHCCCQPRCRCFRWWAWVGTGGRGSGRA